MNKKALHWFRQDLRLSDNPALYEALCYDESFLVYILDDQNSGDYYMGAASRWWLYQSLKQLNRQLYGNLSVFKGDPKNILISLAERHEITSVFWNTCYEPWRTSRDIKIKTSLEKIGIDVQTRNASLLWEPREVLKKDNSPYKLFTPFYNHCRLNIAPPRRPILKPDINRLKRDYHSLSLVDLNLVSKGVVNSYMKTLWKPGEIGAQKSLQFFLRFGIAGYKIMRDFPAKENVSRLSPHLHFGELSPNQAWYASLENINCDVNSDDVCHFHKELAWREFSYNLLYHFPTLPRENFRPKFQCFPWSANTEHIEAWKQGNTGIPIVDAGMRELLSSGYIHNRVRMLVASFLVKNLLIDWREGSNWFWDRLLDADLASNSASWQWIAGSGTDAAPYFRIFNPVFQAKKFDPKGIYVRRFVPELGEISNKYIHNPWEATPDVLRHANVILGRNYPFPIVDLRESRIRALAAYSQIR